MQEKINSSQEKIKEEVTFGRYLRDLDLSEELLKGKDILDIASGSEPEFVDYCLRRGLAKSIYGLDYRSYNRLGGDFFENAPAKRHFIEGDAENLPIAPQSFDLIVMHAPPRGLNYKKVIPAAIKILRPGGELRISFLFRDSKVDYAIRQSLEMFSEEEVKVERKEVGCVETKEAPGKEFCKDVVIIKKCRYPAKDEIHR